MTQPTNDIQAVRIIAEFFNNDRKGLYKFPTSYSKEMEYTKSETIALNILHELEKIGYHRG
jgi:hypothetical protein